MLKIILSRTDSIGDVILSLPMAGYIKEKYPDAYIFFLGKTYTKSVVSQCEHIDEFLNWDIISKDKNALSVFKKIQADYIIHVFPNKYIAKLAYLAKIPNRVGTLGRLPHLLNCNKRIYFTRKNSNLHEAQLNLKLLKPLGINAHKSLEDIIQHLGWKLPQTLDSKWSLLLHPLKKNIVLHPQSQGSAIEWGLNNFRDLINKLPPEEFEIFITGTQKEKELIGDALPLGKSNVHSLLGGMTLEELISFIGHTDSIVAASTGPLHIGAAFGVQAIGLFSNRRPIHPGRWKPLGSKSTFMVFDENCKSCMKGEKCLCIKDIKVSDIVSLLRGK